MGHQQVIGKNKGWGGGHGYVRLWVFGYDGTTTAGHNITSSEMGHLYYEELGNVSRTGIDGSYPQANAGLENTGDFENLDGSANAIYYSGTDYADRENQCWSFNMGTGYQNPTYTFEGYGLNGLAIRSGQISAVPVPGAVWLLGSGLLGFAGVSRRKQQYQAIVHHCKRQGQQRLWLFYWGKWDLFVTAE